MPDEGPVGGVRVEAAGELRGIGVAVITAISAQLLGGQEPIGYPAAISCR
jgi:hypothetical protein